jgi:hypothetical protein
MHYIHKLSEIIFKKLLNYVNIFFVIKRFAEIICYDALHCETKEDLLEPLIK